MSWNLVVNGVLLGGLYAVSALGLSVVFGVLRLVNLAHGSLLMTGGYLGVVLTRDLGLPWPLTVLVSVAAAAGAGFVVQRAVLTQMLVRGADGPLVATFGLSLLASGGASIAFGSSPLAIPGQLGTAGWSVGGLQVRAVYLIAFALAAVLSAGLHLGLTRTRLGTRIRAAAADPATAGLMGINVHRLYAGVFALAAALAAIAGLLTAVAFSVSPDSGTSYLLVAIAVVVLGGVGNIFGTFVGAVFLGVVQTLGAAQFGGGYRDLVVYLLFFVVLTTFPKGLFGWRTA